jgi:hypothetical protein
MQLKIWPARQIVVTVPDVQRFTSRYLANDKQNRAVRWSVNFMDNHCDIFDVLTPVNMKTVPFEDVTPCTSTLPTFRGNLLPPSSRYKTRISGNRSLRNVCNYITRRHILEDRKWILNYFLNELQLHSCALDIQLEGGGEVRRPGSQSNRLYALLCFHTVTCVKLRKSDHPVSGFNMVLGSGNFFKWGSIYLVVSYHATSHWVTLTLPTLNKKKKAQLEHNVCVYT